MSLYENLINLFIGKYYDNYTNDSKVLLDYQLYECVYEPVLNDFNYENPELFKQSIRNLQNEENTIIPKAIKDQLLSESINDIEIFKGKIAIYYYEHFYSNLVIQKILMKPIIEEKLTTIIDDPKQ